MLKLRSVAARDIRKGRVRINDLSITQLLQWANMSRVVLLKPLTCECQRAKLVPNRVEESFGCVRADDWVRWRIKIQHVVTTVNIFVYPAFASAAESFYRVLLPFTHLGVIAVFDDRH
jgi:hypothetical protein